MGCACSKDSQYVGTWGKAKNLTETLQLDRNYTGWYNGAKISTEIRWESSGGKDENAIEIWDVISGNNVNEHFIYDPNEDVLRDEDGNAYIRTK